MDILSTSFWAYMFGLVVMALLMRNWLYHKARTDEKFLAFHIVFFGWTSFWRQIAQLCRNHSNTFIMFKKYAWFGPHFYVVLNEAFLHNIYSKEGRNYVRTPCTDDNGANFQKSVLGSDTEARWKKHRFALRDYFAKQMFRVDGSWDKGKELMMKHMKSWTEQPDGVDLCLSLVKLVCDIRGRVWFGSCLAPSEAEYEVWARNFYDSLDYVTQGKQYSGTHLEAYHKIFNTKVLEYIKDVQAGKGEGVARALGDLYEAGTFNSEDMQGAVSLMIYAITPAFVCFWCVLQLYLRPQYLEKARKSDVFLKMCIKETLRLYPPVPVALERDCIKEDKFGQLKIPVGSKMLLSAFMYHHNQDLWVEWHEWNPYRWEENYNLTQFTTGAKDDAKDRMGKSDVRAARASQLLMQPRASQLGVNPAATVKKRFAPFGGGKHQCMGMQLGQSEATELVRMMITNFDLTILDHRDLLNKSPENRVIFAAYAKPDADVLVRVEEHDDE